jgi:hypothetical protein
MEDGLSLCQLEDLADFERGDIPDANNVEYIAYLWSLLQKLDRDFAFELQRDYKIYIEEIKT